MPFQKDIKVQKITEKTVQTKWGPKKFYLLWAEGEEIPYGTWNKTFAEALNTQKGKRVRIAYEIQGQYQNLIVPERFKGQEGKWSLLLDKLKEIEKRLENLEKNLEYLIKTFKK